jgi:hypothetical protein
MYVEFTLANTDGSPVCLPVGSFHFSLHMEGGTNLHLNGGQTIHVDEAYEVVIQSLTRCHVHVERAPETESDIEDLIRDIETDTLPLIKG